MKLFLIALLLLPSAAVAADKALILNEQRQQALYQMLDAAVRAQGITIAPAALDILNVLRTAPTVTEQPTQPPELKKD